MNWKKNITEFAYGIGSLHPITVGSGAYIANEVLEMPDDFFKRGKGGVRSDTINIGLAYTQKSFLKEEHPELKDSDYFKVGKKLSKYDRKKLKAWSLLLWKDEASSDSELSSLLEELKN